MKALLALLVLSQGVFAFGGDKVGNGGGYWGCLVQQNLVSGQIVDLYEAREEYGLNLISVSGTANEIADERLSFVKSTLTGYAQNWSPFFAEVKSKTRFVDSELMPIDDSLFHIRPLPKYCPKGEWKYVQWANFTDQGQVLIRRDVWENPIVTEMDKAALIWHETIYRWLRVEKGDTNSIRARQIVGILFSKNSPDEMKKLIDKVLGGSEPSPTNSWVCMSENLANEKVFLGTSPLRREAEISADTQCKKEMSGACNPNNIQCDQIESSVPKYFCELRNMATDVTFTARGRSLVEGRFLVVTACAQAPNNYGICTPNLVKCQ